MKTYKLKWTENGTERSINYYGNTMNRVLAPIVVFKNYYGLFGYEKENLDRETAESELEWKDMTNWRGLTITNLTF